MTITTLTTTLFTIVKLPYAYDALEPYISAETMHFHHDKHYAGYVTKLEELIAGTPYDTMTLDEIIRNSDGATFNNAAQVWNHEFFFAQLSPRPQHHPEGMLRAAIIDNFGSVEGLKSQIESAAISLFGSGWVWLAADGDGNLHIVAKQNAGTPLTDGLIPIMCIDVWEHAYYIDYRNMRRDSVEALWKILDWSVLEQRYDDAMV